ncbi:MAG TPA: class I SAM-dependent methyltransferase [Thermoanaerobaculia bacterium]|nr:class I SAM-dependent methyltransferase [Thermoanaerobaculia bacterium]
MSRNEEVAREFWNREVHTPTHSNWMAHPLVRAYINRSIAGDSGQWPMDWLETWLAGRRFKRGLSVGCGAGSLERDLIRRNLCEQMDAFDGSPESIRVAIDEAAKLGYGDRIHYRTGDFNEPQLPSNTYDIVFVHQAMHHVAKLEKLYRAIMKTLAPDGLLYLDEYIGPSRHEWTEQNFAPIQGVFQSIPREKRNLDSLLLPIQVHDPSEAIRSSEILRELAVGYDTLVRRDYGGNVLSIIYGQVEDTDAMTEHLIVEEEKLLREGMEPFLSIIIAKPKRGIAGAVARGRYFLEPKLKRIGREVRKVVSR